MTSSGSIPPAMSGDELQIVTHRPAAIDEDIVGNMDAVVELLFARYQMRHEDEMHWRLKHVLESAFRSGVQAVVKSDVGWTPTCNKCGDEVKIVDHRKWICVRRCHEIDNPGHT